MGAVSSRVFQVEPLRLVKVILNRRHLPGTPDGIPNLHRDLRAIESRTTRIRDQLQTSATAHLVEGVGGDLPVLIGTDEFLLFRAVALTSRQLEVKVIEAKIGQDRQEKLDLLLDFAGGLLTGAVGMGVVLGKTPHTGQSMHDARLLVAVVVTHLEKPQRQLTVRPAP